MFRLQGGISAGLGRVLLEDLVDNTRRAVSHFREHTGSASHSPVTTKAQAMPRSLRLYPEPVSCARAQSEPVFAVVAAE